VNRRSDGSTVIDIDQPDSTVDARQVAINVPDVVQLKTSADGSISPPPQVAVSTPTLVSGDTPTDNVQVAIKSPAGSAPQDAKSTTGPRQATTLNTAAEV